MTRIGILISSNICQKRLFPFAEEANKRGFNLTFLNTLQHNDFTSTPPFGENRPIHPSELPLQNDIDVLFTTDRCLTPPAGAKVVAIPHCHIPIPPYNTDPAAYYSIIPFLAGSDYLVLGQKNILNFKGRDFEKLLAETPRTEQLPSEYATIIPGGYPSQDALLDQLAEKVTIDSVLYVPVEPIKNSKDARCYIKTLEFLSDKFPQKTIRFSPLPLDQGIQHAHLVMESIHRKNVVIDTDYTSPKRYQRSALVITDSSTLAYTFSNATLRPHIQFQQYGFRKQPTHTENGIIVYSMAQLDAAIDWQLASKNQIAKSIEKYRNNSFINIGTTAKYIFENLHQITNRTNAPGWLKVKRRHTSQLQELSGDEMLYKTAQQPSDLLKIAYYSFAWKHLSSNDNANHLFDFKDLISCSQAFTRPSSYNTIHLRIRNKELEYIENGTTFSKNQNAEILFLYCDRGETEKDFNLSNFTQNTPKIFIKNGSTDEKDSSLDSVLTEQDNLSIIIAQSDVAKRFAAALHIFILAHKKGYVIKKPTPYSVHTCVHITNNEATLTPPWDAAQKIDSTLDAVYYIWGSSNYYKQLKQNQKLPSLQKCCGFIDSNTERVGEKVDNLPIYSLSQISRHKKDNFYILLALSPTYADEIVEQIHSVFGKPHKPAE